MKTLRFSEAHGIRVEDTQCASMYPGLTPTPTATITHLWILSKVNFCSETAGQTRRSLYPDDTLKEMDLLDIYFPGQMWESHHGAKATSHLFFVFVILALHTSR